MRPVTKVWAGIGGEPAFQQARSAQAVEFDRRAKRLGSVQDQMFDVFQSDILGQIGDPDLFGYRGDVDYTYRLEGRVNR
ncbi:hypothetical protein A8146_01685 [Mesorhizobium loti]|nr:hypothetical protein A8146_01685 [Mesorhizobium loti]